MCSFITQHNATDVASFEGVCSWHARGRDETTTGLEVEGAAYFSNASSLNLNCVKRQLC